MDVNPNIHCLYKTMPMMMMMMMMSNLWYLEEKGRTELLNNDST